METLVEINPQFGLFEVNRASGELLKQGRRVKLQEQPFRVLLILLENVGQVVTREHIQSRIWHDHTFVDFDSGLRVAVGKLREALGDDAENPRYIETIPKRGYRFLASAVLPIGTAAIDNVNRMPEIQMTLAATARESGFRTSNQSILAAALMLLAANATGAFLFFLHRKKILTERNKVAAEPTNTRRKAPLSSKHQTPDR